MSSVMAIGPGLISGRSNMINEFTVFTNRNGYHGLSIAVDGPSRADIKYNDNRDGTVKVTYYPTIPGEYRVSIKFDGIELRGSPYRVTVRGEDSTHGYSSSRVSYDPNKYHPASIADPFTSSSSPFGSASKVLVSGRGLYSGITNVQNEIVVDVKTAGSGRLHWSIEGPGNVECKNRGLDNGVYKLYYKPDQPGNYTIKIKYDDRDVPGSPFKARVV
ncbi:filamin-A-like isoform X1 [Brevipalpus obovatus]|uniref:filamin-A-like isoform X1 n=1 Tax=Brevipalpus obovatus TaxID=246614 RepID=UPI003D9F2B13